MPMTDTREMLIDRLGPLMAEELIARIDGLDPAAAVLSMLAWMDEHRADVWPPGVYVMCTGCLQFRDSSAGPFSWMSNGEAYCGECR